jgi:hypothetical protein
MGGTLLIFIPPGQRTCAAGAGAERARQRSGSGWREQGGALAPGRRRERAALLAPCDLVAALIGLGLALILLFVCLVVRIPTITMPVLHHASMCSKKVRMLYCVALLSGTL